MHWLESQADAVYISTLTMAEIRYGVSIAPAGRHARLEDFVAGGLYRATVKVKMWRVAAEDVPTDPDARVAFLHAEWRKVNAWVAQHQRIAQ